MFDNATGIGKLRQISPPLFALLICYFLTWSVLIGCLYFHDIDPDGTSYISLALKYLQGDFAHAVSGHWSPLISWLLVPFLALGFDPVFSHKMVSVLLGLFTLLAVERLMGEADISRSVRALYLFALCPLIAWYAESSIMADFLCACMVLFYLHALIHDSFLSRPGVGVKVGLFGAFSYLAKSYNFYFFLLHFTVVNLYYWKGSAPDRRKILLINMVSGFATFILISGLWSGLISEKYGILTVGTAGEYNFSHIRPGHSTLTHPMLTDGLMPPPNDTAFSVWEDPKRVRIEKWSPFKSKGDFRYYLGYLPGNIEKFLRGLAVNPIFDLTVVAFALFSLRQRLPRKITYLFLSIALYPVGYLALYYDGQRYVLIVPILLYILGAYQVDQLFQAKNGRRINALVALSLCTSLMLLTSIRIYRDYPEIELQNDLFRVSTAIHGHLDNANISTEGGNWYEGISLAYFLKAHYYGRVRSNISDDQLGKDLIGNRIKYHLIFGETTHHLKMLVPIERLSSLAGKITVCKVSVPKADGN